MSDGLDYLGSTFINFSNSTFQWVDIKHFHLPADVDDEAALALLIAHDTYGDNYAGGDPGTDPERHGSYWRRFISTASFVATDPDVELATLRAWASQWAEPPERIRAELAAQVYPRLSAAGAVYRLRDLGRAAFHDWGGVHFDFHELVLIGRAAGTLDLLVAADD